jgi:DNA-binding MarR family transcriptional regulator
MQATCSGSLCVVTSRQADLARTSEDLRIVLGRLVRRLRAENTLPLRHATVLARLEREGPIGTSDLAQLERMRPQSMAETIKELEGDGLVMRDADPTDGRRMLIALTRTGRDTLHGDRARREEWLATAIARELTSREQETLARATELLSRLADS